MEGEPCCHLQDVELLLYPGSGQVRGTGGAAQTVEPATAALGWLLQCAGPQLPVKPSLRLHALRTDYDLHVHLPPAVPRCETHLTSGVYLALVSAVTGWTMDPSVRAAARAGTQAASQR